MKEVDKPLYKIEIGLLRIIPMIIAALYLLNTILSYLGMDLPVLSLIGGLSILPLLFLYVSSFVFKFCLYHRMFLYYIVVCDFISYVDYYIGLPFTDGTLLKINVTVAGLFLFIILYLKFKVCRH